MKIQNPFKSKSVNALAFFNILSPLILNSVNFFTVPIFTRLLGTSNYGKIALYSTWVQILTVIIGLQTVGTIATSMVHIEKGEHKKYQSSVLFLSFISFIIVSILMIVFIEPVKKLTDFSNTIIVLMIIQSFGAYIVGFVNITFIYSKQAQKNFAVSLSVFLINIVISLSLIILVFPKEERYMGRILGMAVPNVIFGLIIIIMIFKSGRTFYDKKYWQFCLPLCIPLIFHSLSGIVLSSSDKIMLKHFTDDSTVGIYGLIVTITYILQVIWGALNNTWVPFYYDDMKAGNFDKINERTKRYLFLFTSLIIGFLLISPEVVKGFANEEFWSGIKCIPFLTIAAYFVFLYSFPVNFQFYHKKSVNIAVGTTLAAVINIVLNLILIPILGMNGAAIATMSAYIALFIFHEIIARFVIKQEYNYKLKTFYLSLISVIIASGVYFIFKDLWIIRWVIALIIGGVLLRQIIKNRAIF